MKSNRAIAGVFTNIGYRVDEALIADESVNEPSAQRQNHHEDPPSNDTAAADNVRVEIDCRFLGLLGLVAY